jgi:rod shape-determining protein MreD
MIRGLISFVVVVVAVIVQITIVARIAFPGGTGPDLVLIAVAALALANGPLTGSLTGFWGGLALDVAPPGSHFVGQNALVFCLVGYACGLVADAPSGDGVPEQGHTALFEIMVTAAGAVVGEVLAALLGVMLSDPRVTWPAVRNVLPFAVVYDVLICPFVLYAAAAVLRLAGSRGERDRAAWSGLAARVAASGPNPAAVREVGTGTPRLRLSDRGKGEGWVGGARGQGAGGKAAARREPRLHLGRSGSLGSSLLGSGSRGGSSLGRRAVGAAFATGGFGSGAAKVRFSSRRRQGAFGGSLLGSASVSSGLASSRFGPSRMGRTLLGGSVFSRSPSALSRPAPSRRTASLTGSSFLGRASFLGRSSGLGGSSGRGRVFGSRGRSGSIGSAAGGLAGGHAPRFGRRGALARATGALHPSSRSQSRLRSSALGRSPGRGWLRRSRTGGGGWGSGPRLGTGPARLHMPRRRSKRSWRTGGYR